MGKHHNGKNSRKRILGFKTIISPSKQKIKEHYQKLADKVHHLKAAPQDKLIWTLNPIIRGWCNYQSPWNSSKTYGQLNLLVFRILWRWAKRRHHCQRSFKSGDNLEKHHLIPNNKGGNNSDDNLVLLHLHCHDKVQRNHSKKVKTKAGSHK